MRGGQRARRQGAAGAPVAECPPVRCSADSRVTSSVRAAAVPGGRVPDRADQDQSAAERQYPQHRTGDRAGQADGVVRLLRDGGGHGEGDGVRGRGRPPRATRRRAARTPAARGAPAPRPPGCLFPGGVGGGPQAVRDVAVGQGRAVGGSGDTWVRPRPARCRRYAGRGAMESCRWHLPLRSRRSPVPPSPGFDATSL